MKKILFVDDDPNVLTAFRLVLRKQFVIETAHGGERGLELLKDWNDYGVVVADMNMPKMNGIEFLSRVKQIAPDIVRIMLTGNCDQGTAIDAINEGNIFRFLTKPCPNAKLVEALTDASRQHQLLTMERELLENTLQGSIKVLIEILAMSEPKIFGQAQSLRDNMRRLATTLNVQNTWEMEVAAMLSRIGCITLPPDLLLRAKAGHSLSAKEQELFSTIPAIGGGLLSQIPRLEEVSKIILYQNKCFDGSGFPQDKIAGEEIPLGARMLKILTTLAKLESDGLTLPAGIKKLEEKKDVFDPKIVSVLKTCFELDYPDAAQFVVPPVPILFSELRVGHTLCSDISTKDKIRIVASGTSVTPTLMQRLRNFSMLSGIAEPIYVASNAMEAAA